MKFHVKLAYIYSLTSVIIGPAILFFRPERHPSGWDCSDSSWANTPIAVREAFYEHAARFMIPGASVMFVLGVIVLGYLLFKGLKDKEYENTALAAICVISMLLGYALIISFASRPWCS